MSTKELPGWNQLVGHGTDASSKDARSSIPELGEPGGMLNVDLEWRDRGYLPHVDGKGLIHHVIFRLIDALPVEVVEAMRLDLVAVEKGAREREMDRRVNAHLDQGRGSCLLAITEVGGMVEQSLLHFRSERYHLHEWCIMPNHVHVLLEPLNGWRIGSIVASWKTFTGRTIAAFLRDHPAHKHLLRSPEGSGNLIWMREYWDRYMRDRKDFDGTADYIRMNPVSAGLVDAPEKWSFGSARLGPREE